MRHILKPREIIIEIMGHMIETGLTDFSGGNMALRVGERVYSTPTHSADKYRWRLKPDDIIVTDINRNIFEVSYNAGLLPWIIPPFYLLKYFCLYL